MKSLLCCYILSIACAITGNTQPYMSAHRTIEQFQIYDNSFKTIIRDFIAYEQEYCTEYSINWYISTSIKQLSGHRFNIKVTPIPLEGKSAIIGNNNDKITYIHYYGHYIFLLGDYEKTKLVNSTNHFKEFSYWKNKNPYALHSWTEGYTDITYEYDAAKNTFTLVEYYRDQSLYNE